MRRPPVGAKSKTARAPINVVHRPGTVVPPAGTPRRRAPIAAMGLVALVLLPAGTIAAAFAGGLFHPAVPPAPAGPLHRATAAPADGSSSWVNITLLLNGTPRPRSGGMMAYDSTDGYLLLFGGLSGSGALRDTWTYQNHTWQNLSGTTGSAPPARFKGVLVDDPADGYVVLFGGQAGGGTYFNDTWTFKAGTWSHLATSTAPSPREDAVATYDGALGDVLLFSGEQSNLGYTNDTWTFHAGQWTNITGDITTASPPPRESGTMAYDPADQETVLFGGKPTETSTFADTWTFANDAWTNRTGSLSTAPSPREASTMVWDAADGYLLLFGGLHYPNVLNDTWSFLNNSWTHLAPAVSPSTRFAASLAYYPDQGFGYVVLFGGQSEATITEGNSSANGYNDTWSYKSPLAASVSVSPSPIDAGQTITVSASITGGYPAYTWSWLGLPASCPAGSDPTFTCAPTDTGSFAISINVSDAFGNAVLSGPAALVVNPLPAVSATVSATIGAAPFSVAFSANGTGGSAPLAYNWTFRDGGFATGANATHTYGAAGSYTALVTVVDATGASATVDAPTVTVVNRFTVVAAASNTTGFAPLAVVFNATPVAGSGPYSYAWSFGDGGTATTASPSHTFAANGTFTVTLNASDAIGETASDAVTITVLPALVANFSYTLGAPSCADGVSVQGADLTASVSGGSGGYLYIWTFPNTSLEGGSEINYSVVAGHNYSIELTVADSSDHQVYAWQFILANQLTATTCATTAGQGGGAFPWIYVLIVILAIAIALEVAYMLRRRRRPPAGPPPRAPPAGPPPAASAPPAGGPPPAG